MEPMWFVADSGLLERRHQERTGASGQEGQDGHRGVRAGDEDGEAGAIDIKLSLSLTVS